MYNNFAYIYDRLMYDVDYGAWADYIERMFERFEKKPGLILDLGCGTGSLSIEMAKRGYDMIGIDLSEDMLACAREKSSGEGLDILYLNQDMRSFELYGTVDAVLCLMDSINYITAKKDVLKVLKLVKNYLNPGGILIFDINTVYKLEHVLGNNVFYDIGQEVSYIWQNRYLKKSKKCEFDLTFFIKQGTQYDKYDEFHVEKAYSQIDMEGLINEAGLKLSGVFGELNFKKPALKSSRIFFACEKEGPE